MDPVKRQNFFGQGFVVGQQQAARVAAGVMLLHQLQVTDDMVIIDTDPVELFKQVEVNMGLEVDDGPANITQVIVDT